MLLYRQSNCASYWRSYWRNYCTASSTRIPTIAIPRITAAIPRITAAIARVASAVTCVSTCSRRCLYLRVISYILCKVRCLDD
ncbi:hypothetical protein D3C77_514200 [compost metagenome]